MIRLNLLNHLITMEKASEPIGPTGKDGLFEQPKENGPDREVIETRNRSTFSEHYKYADRFAGRVATYDPKGDYNCGRCSQANGKYCRLVDTVIDPEAGSCGDWEQISYAPNMKFCYKTAEEAKYGVAKNGKGFGCFRCPFASKAFQPDSAGRSLYCGKGDFRVFPKACCSLNGAPTK